MQLKNLIRICAAGSGKTTSICKEAINLVDTTKDNKRILIVTYTNRGISAITDVLKVNNYGVIPSKIVVLTWYSFLLSELIKPLQSYMFGINEVKSLDFSKTYGNINYAAKGTRKRYITCQKNILSNEAAELVIQLNALSKGLVIDRLEKIYSHIYIDEIQDLSSYDIDVVELILQSNIKLTGVGDNKQATFRTNNNAKGKKRTGKDIWVTLQEWDKNKLVSIEKNLESRRFNQDICFFANSVFPNENNMITKMNELTGHDGIFFIASADVNKYYLHYKPAVLRYDKKTVTQNLPSINFGECKGQTFNRLIIFPNNILKDFLFKNISLDSPYKYYVAVTRPRYSIAFVVDKLPMGTKYKDVNIELNDDKIICKQLILEKEESKG